jgi:adenine-specific DNA-methyltransferase
VTKHKGRLELTWTDKDKALLSTGDGRYDYTFVEPSDYRVSEVRLLEEQERHIAEVPDGVKPLFEPTFDNLLITGDAMHVLDALRSIPEYADRYMGRVKLCYIDPPFNTGQVFDNYEDNIEHSIWLTMLRDRLQQIKPLLSGDGSVWVHLDDTEVHRCRVVLDEVMGADSFIATVAWEKDKGRRNDTDISSAHDYLLIYASLGKAWKNVRNLLPRDGQEARYKNPDGDRRGPWLQGDNGTAKSGSTDKNRFEITLPSGRIVTPGKNYWRFSPDAFEEARADGRVWFGRKGDSLPYIKRYLTGVQDGLVPRTLWTADEAGHNQEAKRDHINKMFPDHPTGFATPKPERLLKRIIHIATDPGDIVLDCFAGSGTTAAVAQKTGRRWVTSELSTENVETFTKPRLLKVINGEDDRGISTVTNRVAADGVELPDGMTPVEAQEFNRLLRKALKGAEGNDAATVKALKDATKTRDETTVNWSGGGGFTHLRVGQSMFEEVEGRVFLADWATNGALTKAMCAQLAVRHRPDGIFAGKSGKVRYVILDGMVTSSTVDAILDQLAEDEIVEVWATQVDVDAAERLQKMRPGSRLRSIPDSVLDCYRRKAAKRSPLNPAQPNGEQN